MAFKYQTYIYLMLTLFVIITASSNLRDDKNTTPKNSEHHSTATNSSRHNTSKKSFSVDEQRDKNLTFGNFSLFNLNNNENDGNNSLRREKRCIVVQKQSGTHGDSSEGGSGDGGEDTSEDDPKKGKVNRSKNGRMRDGRKKQKKGAERDTEDINTEASVETMGKLKKGYNSRQRRNKNRY